MEGFIADLIHVTGANMAETYKSSEKRGIFFTNIYPALDESNCSPGSLTYPENTGGLFQSRRESLLHFIARVRFASSSQRRIRRGIVACMEDPWVDVLGGSRKKHTLKHHYLLRY